MIDFDSEPSTAPLRCEPLKRRSKGAQNIHERLILVTELLIARHGVDGVSMRQIGQAAGMNNNSGVQYHFGTKQRLIEAVLSYRQEFLNRRRRELFEALGSPDTLSTNQILRILLRPLIELVDDAGEHVYAQFIWQLQRPDMLGAQPVHLRTLAERDDEFPRLLQQALGADATPIMGQIARSAFAMFLFLLISRNKQGDAENGFDLETIFQLGISMTESALVAATKTVSAA